MAQASSAGEIDFQELMKKCENNFESYESDLRLVRPKLKKEIDAMTQKEFDANFNRDDARILFLSIYWPADLEAKDDGWKRYQFCSEANWSAQKTIANSGSSSNEKRTKTSDTESCMHVAYDKSKLLYPLDRLIACYKKHSKE
jgi:hypothetical protein